MIRMMEKTPEDALQQELQRERAQVLARAGDSVDRALGRLHHLDQYIVGRCRTLEEMEAGAERRLGREFAAQKRQLIKEVNENIAQYNRLREYARLRYHYLIVTREAMGLRRHQRVEEIYPIPPKKREIQEA